MIHTPSLPALADMSRYHSSCTQFDNPYPSPSFHYKHPQPFTGIPSSAHQTPFKAIPPIVVSTPDMSCREMWNGEKLARSGLASSSGSSYLNAVERSSGGQQDNTMAPNLMTPPSSFDLHKHQKDSFSGPVHHGAADPQLFAPEQVLATSPPISPLFQDKHTRLPSLDEAGLRQYAYRQHISSKVWAHPAIERPSEADYILFMEVAHAMRSRVTRDEEKERNRSRSASLGKVLNNGVSKATQRRTSPAKASNPSNPRIKPTALHQRCGSSVQLASANKRSAQAISQALNGENKSSRAKSTKPTTETDWTKVPDYSPSPCSMKDGMAHARNDQIVRPFGGGTSIEHDPERHLLSEPEALVATKLSLTCDKYLLSKRLILQGFAKYLRNRAQSNENWNKTAAQKCCNIDVSKTSAIWAFYNAVGLFDDDMHEHYNRRFEELS